jgi:hypothetical protein
MGSNALFPLTLTLSPRERESPFPRCKPFDSARLIERRARVLPLPEGEGWGEGKGDSRLSCHA